MSMVGSYEAKTHLPQLLERVSKGERFVITKHGVPVAVLQQPGEQPPLALPQVIEELAAFRGQLEGTGRGTSRKQIKKGRR